MMSLWLLSGEKYLKQVIKEKDDKRMKLQNFFC